MASVVICKCILLMLLFCGSVCSWCNRFSDRSIMVVPFNYFLFQTGLTKAMVCAILSVGGIVLIKNILLLIEKSSPCSGGNMFLFHYPNDPLPYVQCDTTIILFN